MSHKCKPLCHIKFSNILKSKKETGKITSKINLLGGVKMVN